MEYTRFDLNEVAKHYFLTRLESGLTCAQKAFSDINVNVGKVHTFLPGDSDETKRYAFDTGGLPDLAITRPFVVDYIHRYLGGGPANVAIFEDSMACRRDPCVVGFETNLAFYGEEIYHILTGCHNTVETIHSYINWSSSAWQNLVLLTSSPEGVDLEATEELSEDLITQLAERAKVIIVDAYDLDGYLIWEL